MKSLFLLLLHICNRSDQYHYFMYRETNFLYQLFGNLTTTDCLHFNNSASAYMGSRDKNSLKNVFHQCSFNCREGSTGGVLTEKLFLKISQNSQENTCAKVSYLIKLQVLTPPDDSFCLYSATLLQIMSYTAQLFEGFQRNFWQNFSYRHIHEILNFCGGFFTMICVNSFIENIDMLFLETASKYNRSFQLRGPGKDVHRPN